MTFTSFPPAPVPQEPELTTRLGFFTPSEIAAFFADAVRAYCRALHAGNDTTADAAWNALEQWTEVLGEVKGPKQPAKDEPLDPRPTAEPVPLYDPTVYGPCLVPPRTLAEMAAEHATRETP